MRGARVVLWVVKLFVAIVGAVVVAFYDALNVTIVSVMLLVANGDHCFYLAVSAIIYHRIDLMRSIGTSALDFTPCTP